MDVSRFDPFEIDFQINFQLIIEMEGSCVDVSRFTSIQIYFPIDFQIFFSPDFIIQREGVRIDVSGQLDKTSKAQKTSLLKSFYVLAQV